MRNEIHLSEMERLFEEEQYQEIVDYAFSLPEEERTIDVTCVLAKMCNKTRYYVKAWEYLSVYQNGDGEDHGEWNHQQGLCLLGLYQQYQSDPNYPYENGIRNLERAIELGVKDNHLYWNLANAYKHIEKDCHKVFDVLSKVEDPGEHEEYHRKEKLEALDACIAALKNKDENAQTTSNS